MELYRRLTLVEYRIFREFLFSSAVISAGNTYVDGDTVICRQFADYGVNLYLVLFRKEDVVLCSYLRIRVNLANFVGTKSRLKLFPLTAGSIDLFVGRMASLLSVFPKGFDCLDDYRLARIDLTVDVRMSRSCRHFLIIMANRCPIPRHWKRIKWFDAEGKKHKTSDHRVEIASSSRAVILYDKAVQLERQGIKDLDSAEAEGIMRFEVSLKAPYIRSVQSKFEFDDVVMRDSPAVFLYFLSRNGDEFFLKAMRKIFHDGDYHKLSSAFIKIAESRFLDGNKSKMKDFLKCSAVFKSAETAASKLKDNTAKTMLFQMLDQLNVNPVIIPRRWEIDVCCSIPKILEIELSKDNEPA
ncbi:MAG: hypothetical protein Q4B70_15355 [Lachnospiraceae bacterium]|nr:hypothetical protein [Lachnospiraceae bacterium]